MMKKEGPCHHCGVTSTPIWRNGPPEKPVLCNACGTRWKKRGTLLNYTPARCQEDTDAERKQSKKRPSRRILKNEPCSDKNIWKTRDADSSSRSGSGSALSYSESCALYGSVDASEMAGSAQSLVPSRKKSSVGHRKLSLVEALAEILKSVMHEEKDCDQDSVLLEVPRNARHPEAELLISWPPPTERSSVALTAVLPPSYQSQLR